jgi:hypothetical protein
MQQVALACHAGKCIENGLACGDGPDPWLIISRQPEIGRWTSKERRGQPGRALGEDLCLPGGQIGRWTSKERRGQPGRALGEDLCLPGGQIGTA